MKLISNNPTYKEVEYFGIDLRIPKNAEYVATDADGKVWVFEVEPDAGGDYWSTEGDPESAEHVADVDLEGMDWKDTLVVLP